MKTRNQNTSKPSTTELAMDQGISFQEEVRMRFNERRKDPNATPKLLNKYSPFLFLAEISGVWYYGTWEAIPFLYADFGEVFVTAFQGLICFLTVQVMINWWCVRCVDSKYDPQRHGTHPQFLSNQQVTRPVSRKGTCIRTPDIAGV